MSRRDYMELYQLYQMQLVIVAANHSLWLLLRGHMLELQDKMYKQLCNQEQKKFNLVLSPVQALAFSETWNRLDTSMYPLGTVVVARCVQEIDKVVKNSKVYV